MAKLNALLLPGLLSTLFFAAVTATGCASSVDAQDEESTESVSQESLTGSDVAKKLVGSWKAVGNLFPRVELGADGTYTLDTGIRCVKAPCPSGEAGKWALYRGASGTYYTALFPKGNNPDSWYSVKLSGGKPTQLVGAFGTKGKLEPIAKTTYCVEWQSANEDGTPGTAFYAENVATYQAGKDKLAQIGLFVNEAINEGTCAARPQLCTKQYQPVCGQVFNEEPLKTFGNVCELKVAIRQRAGVDAAAKGRWDEGACQVAPTGPFCGGIAGIKCPGLGTCTDNPSDSCDPAKGGADCGGVCVCEALAKCAAGMEWDASPEVCACVKPVTNPCALAKCGFGSTCEVHDGGAVCVSNGQQPCGKSTCAAGTVCCNASCGVCTPPGFACTQQACNLSVSARSRA